MLLIPDYDSNDNSDKHAVVNKKYVDSKTFTFGFDMKGNKEINVVDQTSAKDGSNESDVDTKQVVC